MSFEQRAQLKLPQIQAIAQQFPWVQENSDGRVTFQAIEDLRRTEDPGWWTEAPHDHWHKSTHDIVWGSALLQDEQLDDRKGWMLPDTHIPWLDFATIGASSPPKSPPSFEHTWASYYKWRGLPLESHAALLLHWPMTVYRLLHKLGLASSAIPIQRRQLTIHLIGIEKELDFLPM